MEETFLLGVRGFSSAAADTKASPEPSVCSSTHSLFGHFACSSSDFPCLSGTSRPAFLGSFRHFSPATSEPSELVEVDRVRLTDKLFSCGAAGSPAAFLWFGLMFLLFPLITATLMGPADDLCLLPPSPACTSSFLTTALFPLDGADLFWVAGLGGEGAGRDPTLALTVFKSTLETLFASGPGGLAAVETADLGAGLGLAARLTSGWEGGGLEPSTPVSASSGGGELVFLTSSVGICVSSLRSSEAGGSV